MRHPNHVQWPKAGLPSPNAPARSRKSAFCLAGAILFGLAPPLPTGQASTRIAGPAITLRVLSQTEPGPVVGVDAATLTENVRGTTGFVSVRNTSPTPLENVVLYAEYFGRGTRPCFSLLFSLPTQSQSDKHEHPVIPPGGVRTLAASAPGMFPAIRPTEIRIRLVRSGTPHGSGPPPDNDKGIPAPAIIFPYGHWNGPASFTLGSEVKEATEPMLSLLFAEVKVDSRGAVVGIDVLESADEGLSRWFTDPSENHITFYPAGEQGSPEPGRLLVMVEALLSRSSERLQPFSPADIPWVKSYAARLPNGELPSVSVIFLRHPPRRVMSVGGPGRPPRAIERPPSPPRLFETVGIWDWSPNAFDWVSNATSPDQYARRLVIDRPN